MNLFFKKISWFLWLSFILVFTWQTRLIFLPSYTNNWYFEYGTLSLYFSDLVIVLSALFLAVAFISNFRKISLKKIPIFWYWLGVWEVFLIISIFQADNLQLSLWHYLWFIILAIIICLFSYFYKKKPKLILHLFLLGVLPQAVLAIYQFIYQKTFAFKYLGLASHSPSKLGDVVIETASGRWLRAYGGLDHPNILAALMAMAILVAIYLLLLEANKKFNLKRLKISIWLWLSLLINFLALFFSFSRSVWLAFVLAFIFLLAFSCKNLKMRGQAIKIFSSLLVFSAILITTYYPLIFQRFDLNSRLENKSVSERYQQNLEAKEIIKNNLFFGVGLGNYTLKLREIKPEAPAYELQPVHNSFLLLWAETGIFSLVAFLSFLLYIFYKAWQKKQTLSLSLLLLLLIIFLSEHWLFSLHFGWLFLGLVFSFIILLDDNNFLSSAR
ncbi:MAG: O-antigen ligase family protein [Candidatus Pacebacteria bacterium]|nr:O-antigen ligase family protein [Candidatus Paceibacterota bacterium]